MAQTDEVLLEVKDLAISFFNKSGEIQEWKNCIPLRYNFYKGTRQIKLLNSGQIRQLRDVCVFMINDMEVHL